MEPKERFLKAYADVPSPLRKEIIIVIEGKTYTWDSVYFEIKNNTELSGKILKSLSEIDLI